VQGLHVYTFRTTSSFGGAVLPRLREAGTLAPSSPLRACHIAEMQILHVAAK
jgi:hypothetical protein